MTSTFNLGLCVLTWKFNLFMFTVILICLESFLLFEVYYFTSRHRGGEPESEGSFGQAGKTRRPCLENK